VGQRINEALLLIRIGFFPRDFVECVTTPLLVLASDVCLIPKKCHGINRLICLSVRTVDGKRCTNWFNASTHICHVSYHLLLNIFRPDFFNIVPLSSYNVFYSPVRLIKLTLVSIITSTQIWNKYWLNIHLILLSVYCSNITYSVQFSSRELFATFSLKQWYSTSGCKNIDLPDNMILNWSIW